MPEFHLLHQKINVLLGKTVRGTPRQENNGLGQGGAVGVEGSPWRNRSLEQAGRFNRRKEYRETQLPPQLLCRIDKQGAHTRARCSSPYRTGPSQSTHCPVKLSWAKKCTGYTHPDQASKLSYPGQHRNAAIPLEDRVTQTGTTAHCHCPS